MLPSPQIDPSDFLSYLAVACLLALPFIYDKRRLMTYHGKFMVYYVTISTIAIGCIPLFALNPKNVKNCYYISYVLKHVTKLIGIEWELRDGEHLAEDRGAIIVANHQSTLDILGMFNFWHVMGKCAAVAKKEIFYVWPFGLAAWLAGVVFIDRSSASKSYKQLDETSKLTQRDKTKIFMFPEGTRNLKVNKTGKLLPFKKGAFKMAIACQVPVIPIIYSPYYFIDSEEKYFGEGKIIVKALPAIPTTNLTEDDLDDLMNKVRDVMADNYEQLRNEIIAKLPKTHPMSLLYTSNGPEQH